jgi:hypothetical protein
MQPINTILLQNLSTEQLTELIGNVFDTKFKDYYKPNSNETETNDLIIREQVLDLLQINASTLYRWTKQGRITVYKYSNKCYYKRSEILATITPLKK